MLESLVVNQEWHTVEFLGYSYYASRGYRILAPLVHHHGYDFVIEGDGKFKRVNVKKATPRTHESGRISWYISKSGSQSRDLVGACDVYLAYVPLHNKFLELPGDFLDGFPGKVRYIPSKLIGV